MKVLLFAALLVALVVVVMLVTRRRGPHVTDIDRRRERIDADED